MKKQKKQKTRNIFMGVILLAILIGVVAWIYLSLKATTLVISSDKPAYFTIDKPEITISLLNPKNANSGEIVVEYPEDNIFLEEYDLQEGVFMREVGVKLYFELSPEFFESKTENIGNLKFSVLNTGSVEIRADENSSFLDSREGIIEFQRFDNANFAIGLTDDIAETEKVRTEKDIGIFEGI